MSIARIIGLLAVSLLLAGPASAQTPNETFRDVGKIVTPDAIETQGLVPIGGIEQWISVRGRHRDNPILLFLHGGPGFTTSPVSYYFMHDWEEYFTVVQWDQRGAGKTYGANDPAVVGPTLTVNRMVDDAEAMAAYLRRKYGRRKIILMAHSFGTVIGLELAQRHPDWFYAYVGMGQFIDFSRSEALGYRDTLADARADGNAAAITDLEAIAPFPDAAHPERNLQNLGKERQWLATYGGYYWRGKFGHNAQIAQFSPDFSAAELKQRDEAQGFSDQILWGEIGHINLSDRTRFKTPVVILQGRHDRGTSSSVVGDWFAKVRAPSKKIVWFDDSAHMVYEEEPAKLLVTLVDTVLPLTRKAR